MGKTASLYEFDNAQPSFKNKIINGAFDIWQRGNNWTLSNTNTGFLADRWYTGMSATSGTLDVDEAEIIDNGKYYSVAKFVSTIVGGTGNWLLEQPIEDFKDIAGKVVTLSFKYRCNASHDKNIYLVFRDDHRNTTNQVIIDNPAFSVIGDSTFRTVSFTFDATNIAPVGTTTCCALGFTVGTDIANTFEITEIQLEEGSTATAFEQRPIGYELALCQRYYQTFPFMSHFATALVNSTVTLTRNARIHFTVPMRVIPTLTYDSSGFTTSPIATIFSYGAYWSGIALSAGTTTFIENITADAEL